MCRKKKVYVLSSIIDGVSMTTVGVFDDMNILQSVMDRWELVDGIKIEFYFKEVQLNVDDLSANPERHFNRPEMETVKPYLRDSKLVALLDGR